MIFFRSLSSISALSFDLDDTLYENHSLMIKSEQKLQLYLASKYPETSKLALSNWRQIKRTHLVDNPDLASDMGELRRRTLASGLASVGYQNQQLKTAVDDCYEYFYFERSNFKVDKNICSLLSKLSSKVPLVAITNGNVNLAQIGIDSYFKYTFKANIRQPMKPHPVMFNMASDALKINPSEILHIGDSLEKDVKGAISAGMQSGWFACDRKMHLTNERISVLPHIQLNNLKELSQLVL